MSTGAFRGSGGDHLGAIRCIEGILYVSDNAALADRDAQEHLDSDQVSLITLRKPISVFELARAHDLDRSNEKGKGRLWGQL